MQYKNSFDSINDVFAHYNYSHVTDVIISFMAIIFLTRKHNYAIHQHNLILELTLFILLDFTA
jgi:hypothetical protein